MAVSQQRWKTQSILLSKLEDAIGCNVKLNKELIKLQEDLAKLDNSSKNRNDSYGQNNGNKIIDGFLSGIGREFASFAIDFFSWWHLYSPNT